MNKQTIIIWSPAIIGVILLLVTKIDLYPLQNQNSDIQNILLREIPIVIIGLLCSIDVFLSSVYWFIKKQWLVAIQSLVSSALFIGCFGIGGAMGGAFLNAT